MNMLPPSQDPHTRAFGVDAYNSTNLFYAQIIDLLGAAAVGCLTGYAAGLNVGVVAGVAIYAISVLLLRGLRRSSVGDMCMDIQFERATDSGRPGIVRCAVYEVLSSLNLLTMGLSWAVRWFLEPFEFGILVFALKMSGLRVA